MKRFTELCETLSQMKLNICLNYCPDIPECQFSVLKIHVDAQKVDPRINNFVLMIAVLRLLPHIQVSEQTVADKYLIILLKNIIQKTSLNSINGEVKQEIHKHLIISNKLCGRLRVTT